MTAASRSQLLSDWRDMPTLWAQIVSASSLAAQHDRMITVVSGLVEGNVEVWLRENLFRLPNLEEGPLFPEQPSLPGMQHALKSGRLRTKQRRGKNNAPRATWAAIPIMEQGMVLGALQSSRLKGPEFKQEELDLRERLAGVIAVR